MSEENALDYNRPTSNVPAYKSERQNLGKVFKTSEYLQGTNAVQKPVPGTFTGKGGVGNQIKKTIKRRDDDPFMDGKD